MELKAYSFAVFLAAGIASGAAAAPVALEDVVQGALKGGPALERENLHVDRAAGQLQQAQGAFDWTATVETGPEKLYVARADASGALTNDVETVDAWHTVLGAGKLFRNGISVQPGISFYSGADATAAQTQGLTKARPALNLTIPLFRGYGSNNTAAAAEKAAMANLEGTRAGRQFVAQRTVYDGVTIFWRCLATRHHREEAEAGQRSADDDVTNLRQQVGGGQAEPALLDRAVARRALQHVSLSQFVSLDESCRTELAVYAGTQPDGSLPVAEGDFPSMDGMAAQLAQLDEQALVERAYRDRLDLQALSHYRAAQYERLQGTQDSTQPKVDLYVDTTRVLVRLSKTLGNDLARGQEAEAAANESEARINFEQLRTQIRADVAAQLRALRESLANGLALNQSEALLERVVADAARRVQAGILTNQEYHATEQELAQLRNQVIDVRLQFASGLAGLRLAIGAAQTEGATPAIIATSFRSLP